MAWFERLKPRFERFDKIDSRYIYLAVFLSVLLPLFRPIGLPITVGEQTREAFLLVDGLPQGALVIMSPSFAPSSDAEVVPQMMALLKHLMSKNAKLLWVNLTVEGSMYATRAMDSLKDEFGYEYGRDYVITPYLPGQQTAIASIASDIKGALTVDVSGKPVWDMEAVSGVSSVSDFDLLIDFNTGDTCIYYLQQVQPKGVRVIAGASGVTVPYLMPYLGSGQLAGLLGGLRGAAEYEMVSKTPGLALGGMDAQSLSHAAIVLFII
ncbi:MAG TPA: hypothetical protein GXX23_07635, partial [Firmicutes bacterium]|nr:hypothetical protein [Candidatus Fermentithermobacillaceae bacterium]